MLKDIGQNQSTFDEDIYQAVAKIPAKIGRDVNKKLEL